MVGIGVRENGGSERLSDLPKVTQLESVSSNWYSSAFLWCSHDQRRSVPDREGGEENLFPFLLKEVPLLTVTRKREH